MGVPNDFETLEQSLKTRLAMEMPDLWRELKLYVGDSKMAARGRKQKASLL
jgi:hypothetical protein